MTFATTSPLMPHQEAAVAKLLPSRVGAMFMEMGTGKSRCLLELARLRLGKWDRLIWICPVSLKATVLWEILKHTDVGPDRVFVFDHRTKAATVPKDRLIYVIGIESIASSSRVATALDALVSERSFVAVDESSYIKGNRALRTKRITLIGARARYRMIMTGTPFTQGVVDLFAQMKFLSPKILGYQSFWSFANNHLVFEEVRTPDGPRRTGRVVSSLGHGYLADRMAPYVYQVRKDECLSLPDKTHKEWMVEMTAEQVAAHEEAKAEFLLRRDPADFSPIELFRLFTALQTIACGWWHRGKDKDGADIVQRLRHDRLDLLEGLTDMIPPDEKVIFWAKYRIAAADISARLAACHGAGAVARFDGSLPEAARNAELARWRTDARFLVATQAAGSHGLTLNEARHAIFYADGFKYSERIQAEDRNHRIGQDARTTYHTIVALPSIDNRIREALRSKGNALRSFMAEVDKVRTVGLKDSVLNLVRAL